MSDKSAERVLVVPTAVFHQAGLFQGFSPRVDHYLPLLLESGQLSYLPRSLAENDPTHKQLIPYVVMKWRDQVFHYTRGKGGSEVRLRALRSIGVGGHINEVDAGLFDVAYREAMFREVAEEVHLESKYEEHCIGLINDDATPVGQVHLGIVHVFELAEPKVRRRESVLTRAGFAPLAELRQQREEFETWSQFVLDVLGETDIRTDRTGDQSMTSADLQKLVGQKPFVPLRLYISDGTVHDIRSRELIWVGTGMTVIVVPLSDQGDAEKPLIERTIHIDLRHIVKVETEAAQVAP